MGLAEKIGDAISDFWDNIVDSIATGCGDKLSDLYSFKVYLFDTKLSTSDINSTITSLCNFNNVKSNTIYKIGKVINEDCVIPVALSLLTLFFMISLIKRFTEIEKVQWERVLLWGCYFFFIKALVDNSYSLLTKIMEQVNSVYTSVVANNQITGKGYAVGTLIEDAFASYNGLGEVLIGLLLYAILAIPFIGSMVQIWAQIILRIVKLTFCMSFAPIPIAMSVEGEVYRGKAISYLMYSAGVAFESITIYLGGWIYTEGIRTLSDSRNTEALPQIIGVLVMNALFIAILQLGHEFSEKMFSRS